MIIEVEGVRICIGTIFLYSKKRFTATRKSATRALGTHCDDPEGARLEEELGPAVNMLGVGPQGLGGDSTAFAVHVETAATHITMNPVAVNMQCHSARRARATFRPSGIEYGY